jgi:SNF2 family DNA or RNA helicase
MLEQMDHFYTSRDQRFRKMIKEFKTVSDSDFEVPVSLEKILRPYQAYGFKWLRTLAEYGFGGILADDMGLGKTLQMIAVLLLAKEKGEADPSLVVCPASLVYNWEEELARFAPSLKTLVIAGNKAERELRLKRSVEYDVLITSYDLLKRDILQYSDLRFNYMVIDEAQFVKTQTTAAAKSVRLVQARRRFALTGTPIENRLSELWSIFDFLMPGYLYNYEVFKRQFETPIARSQDQEISSRLQKMISPFVLRRLKGDVLKELPDKLEEVRYVRFEGEQQRLYDAQATKIRAMLEKTSDEDVKRNKIQILAQLTRIRQICCDPSLIFEDYQAASAKREACLDLIRSAMDGGHRILLFSQFTSMLALLEKDLTDAGIEWYTITGATPKQERVDLVRRFNEGDIPVFLISLKVGGTGLNLTGADTVIHYDPWWNVAAQNQATDRAHRIGQIHTVCVYKLIGKDTVEEKILKLQQDKQDLADEILSGEGRSISAMSREELMALLG